VSNHVRIVEQYRNAQKHQRQRGVHMSESTEWSPDEALGTETFRQGDVAEDENERISRSFLENLEQDPSLDPALVADERELQELGAQLDDPELLVTLDGGMDDPDGIDLRRPVGDRDGDEGWDLSAPLVAVEEDGDMMEDVSATD
jgi:hypothetical protein